MCHILEACATIKVAKLQFGELIVEFGASIEKNQQIHSALTQVEHEKQNEAQVQELAAELRQQEIEELMITDPERYEELLQKGELRDANS